MMTRTLLPAAAIAALVAIGGAGPARAGLALEFSTGTLGVGGNDGSDGWSFTTNQAITVTALDAFDPTGDGNAGEVRLYNAGGTVLASAKVTTSDPQKGSPILFYSAAITPVSLAASTEYFIAEDFGTATHGYLLVSALTTVPAITYGAGVAVSAQGQNPTTDSNGGSFNPAYFGPNFEIATAVPEPASLAIFGTALAGLGVMRRRRRRKDV